MKNFLGFRKQQGTAIIMALFVTSLVVVAFIAMNRRFQMDLRDMYLVSHSLQGNHYAEGSISWAKEQLNNDWLQKQSNQLVDLTPIQSPVNTVNQAEVGSIIYDAEGRFNINNLIDSKYVDNFIRLIHLIDPAIDENAARDITFAVIDWISPGKNTMLEDYYLQLTPAYRVPHRPMVSISELRMVKGVNAALFMALAPYIIALPEVTPININNTSIPVLFSLSNTLTISAAKKMIDESKASPFKSVQAFLASDVMKASGISEEKLTVLSHYFLVKTNVTWEQQNILLYTLMKRLEQSKPTEMVLWQSKGTL